jgi:hypothetical protein
MPTYVQLTCVICDAKFEKEYKKRNYKTCSKKCSYILRQETRRKRHTPVDKQCSRCGETFQDTSKKKQVITCKPCVGAKMVESRMKNSNGIYHSDEWRKNRSEKQIREGGWKNCNTPEHRKSNSLHKVKWIQQHPEWSSGKRGNGGYRKDLGRFFRSEWEAAYARYLNANGIPWEYEIYAFILSNGKNYLPDFYLPQTDEWVEVKGWWDDKSIEKCNLFETDYPNETLVKIDKANYNMFKPYIKYVQKGNK